MKNEYTRVFRAFTDENRINVLKLLCEGEKCACVLLDNLKISQPTLSHHMKILCDSGIVKGRRVGRWKHYSINNDGCEYAGRFLSAIINRDMDRMLRIISSIYSLLRNVGVLPDVKTDAAAAGGCLCCSIRN